MFTALLVDDEPVAVQALKRRVNWEKYQVDHVLTAGSMEQAQECFQTHPISFMLSDVEMPQGNGLELFEWVKLHYPSVECIYVTCHPEYEYMREAMRLGSADYLLKPIDYEELDEILTQLIARLQKEQTPPAAIPDNVVIPVAAQESKRNLNPLIHQTQEYLLRHIQENMTIDEIAENAHLNSQYLMRLFKKETGTSILEYITNERITLAKGLLESTDDPINLVADTVGYGNYSYFTKIFRREVGVSPKKYRQIHRDKETAGKNR